MTSGGINSILNANLKTCRWDFDQFVVLRDTLNLGRSIFATISCLPRKEKKPKILKKFSD